MTVCGMESFQSFSPYLFAYIRKKDKAYLLKFTSIFSKSTLFSKEHKFAGRKMYFNLIIWLTVRIPGWVHWFALSLVGRALAATVYTEILL